MIFRVALFPLFVGATLLKLLLLPFLLIAGVVLFAVVGPVLLVAGLIVIPVAFVGALAWTGVKAVGAIA